LKIEKTKLCLFASASGIGGGEKNLLDIAKHFAKKENFKVYAICPAYGVLTEQLVSAGVEVGVVAMPSIFNPFSVLKMKGLLHRWQINLSHAHGARAALYARIASRLAGKILCIYTIHGLHYVHYSNKLLKWLFMLGERALVKWTERFICVCYADLEKCKSYRVIDENKAIVIYNGLADITPLNKQETQSIKREFGIRETDKFILHVSRFHPQKGQNHLLNAIPKVVASSSNAKFVLVGDGELYESLKEKARMLNLSEDCVVFAGQRRDAKKLMQACDLFVLSSLWEGLPYVVLEAMAAAKPVVSTDVDGIPEAVVDGKTGNLVPPRNPDALADALIDLLKDDDKAKLYGQAGREKFLAEFTIDKMYKNIEKLYVEVLKNN